VVILVTGSACAQFQFEDVTVASGLREPLAHILGHGAAWGDVDGDGDLDLYVGGFADRPNDAYGPPGRPVPSQLFVNLDDGTFRVADGPTRLFARTSGAVFADLNNDGLPELFMANNARGKTRPGTPEPQASAKSARSVLFENRKGTLRPLLDSGATPESLLSARNVGVLDYDGDGLLDLLVVEDRFTKQPGSALFRNLGGLRFEDATRKAGLSSDVFGLGLAVGDVNGDRKPDWFFGHSNRMWVSAPDGRWTEPESVRRTLAWTPLHNEDWPCGAVFGDLNRDRLPDLVIGIHGDRARNRVFLHRGVQNGTPVFEDVTRAVGLPDHWPEKCPHVEIQDFDNDGYPDLYFSSGWVDPAGRVTPLIYRHLGVRDGLPVFAAPVPGKDDRIVYFPAGPSADYDGDGRVDLFLVNWFEDNHCRLLRNVTPAGNWLEVELVCRRGVNRAGIGAEVTVSDGPTMLGVREMSVGYGYASGQPPILHFGLGQTETVQVRVMLPDGTVVARENVKADRKVVISI